MSAYGDIKWYNALVRTEGKTCDRVVFDEYNDAEHEEPEEYEQPSEKIVRCGDCAKWSFFDIVDGVRFGDCAEFTHLGGFGHATDENGFCAWGERMQDNEIQTRSR